MVSLSRFQPLWVAFQLIPAVLSVPVSPRGDDDKSPLVNLPNGTLAGAHNPAYDQDFFLGVPYAASPIGDLRLRRPAPPMPWNGTLQTDTYGPWCLGNSLGLTGFSIEPTGPSSEDCLYMNIVRPSSAATNNNGSELAPLLPVLAWIHGGGWQEGSANDPRYNGSFLVRNSVEMGTPIIFASFNYRLGLFGRMSGPSLQESGASNLALHDQRQALAWIQENIQYFGGDKSRVTIMGESAGGANVGLQLLAPDAGLFSGAIAQSSGPYGGYTYFNETEAASAFDATLNATGCTDAIDALSCLRDVPAELLQSASLSVPQAFVLDGDILTDRASRILANGGFVQVPLLIGSNRNDGTSLLQLDIQANGPINTVEDFGRIVTSTNAGRPLPEDVITNWWNLYQEEIDNPSPGGLGTVEADGGPELGTGYGKSTLWLQDNYFAAGRRYSNQMWSDRKLPSYSYLFDTPTANLRPEVEGATHFMEIPYVFGNEDAVGWEDSPYPEDPELRAKHLGLADAMSRMWISFVATASPDHHQVSGLSITWPEWSRDSPVNMVFSATEGIHVQADIWRQEALQSFVDLAEELGR